MSSSKGTPMDTETKDKQNGQSSNASNCFNCNKPGHFSRDCTQPRKFSHRGRGNRGSYRGNYGGGYRSNFRGSYRGSFSGGYRSGSQFQVTNGYQQIVFINGNMPQSLVKSVAKAHNKHYGQKCIAGKEEKEVKKEEVKKKDDQLEALMSEIAILKRKNADLKALFDTPK